MAIFELFITILRNLRFGAILGAILNFLVDGGHFEFFKVAECLYHARKPISRHQSHCFRAWNIINLISDPPRSGTPRKSTLGPFFQNGTGPTVFYGKFQSRNRIKHKVNTISHVRVAERRTICLALPEQNPMEDEK